MMFVDDNWTAIITNLPDSWKVRDQLSSILGREGSDARTLGDFYIAVIQETFLFGLEMWAMTPRMAQTLGGFHHRV